MFKPSKWHNIKFNFVSLKLWVLFNWAQSVSKSEASVRGFWNFPENWEEVHSVDTWNRLQLTTSSTDSIHFHRTCKLQIGLHLFDWKLAFLKTSKCVKNCKLQVVLIYWIVTNERLVGINGSTNPELLLLPDLLTRRSET